MDRSQKSTSSLSAAKIKTREPKNSPVLQQSMPACKPFMEPLWVVFIFMAAAVLLVPIGAVCTAYSMRAVEVSSQYDKNCWQNLTTNEERQAFQWQNAANDAALTCTTAVRLLIEEDMDAPVYMFFEINRMHQNHRRYVISKSELQLVNKSGASTGQCDPQEIFNSTRSQIIDPCGLVAWTYFNDTYSLAIARSGTTRPLPVRDDVAENLDVRYKFANYTPSFLNPVISSLRGGGNITGGVRDDERFINWMRLAIMPKFRKLWGIIDTDLKAGDIITVSVINRYNTYQFDGSKSVVLSTTTWLGVRNPFLGIAFLVVGCLSAALALTYGITVAVWGYRKGSARQQLQALGYMHQ